MAQQFSIGSKFFLDCLDEDNRKKFIPFLKNFERCCVLSDFEDALKSIPFDTDEYKEKLEDIYHYIRQIVLSKLSQRMLVSSLHKNDKNGQDSIESLINRIAGEKESGSGANRLLIELTGNNS